MEWMSRFNEALGYIEAHLDTDIHYEKAARIACCSTFHFQRMFTYIVGVPLSEYIRRRRLTLAVFDLQRTDDKIIDIALKYGYESPTAFNRAFQSIHGLSPSAAKQQGALVKAFPKISLQIMIKGDVEMNYKIEKKAGFRIIGVKKHFSASVDESFTQVPLFWQKTLQSGIVSGILACINREPYGLLGVCTALDGQDFDYYIAAASTAPTPKQLVDYDIPECTWAIFECIGAMPYAIQQLQKRIITEWLPTSGYEYADAPDIEVYLDGNQQSPDYRCEVWLPIRKS